MLLENIWIEQKEENIKAINPEIEEKKAVNLINEQTTPLKCEGKKDNTKNTKNKK